MQLTPEREAVIKELYYDRPKAHDVLFGKRHKHPLAPLHHEIIRDFHDQDAHRAWIGFRGLAKSSLMEDAVALEGGFREFKNCLLIGATLDGACDRLHAIRRQFERNALLIETFGNLKGPRWGDELLELANGSVIFARGVGQEIRGTKGEDVRPDLIVCDDIEDRNTVRSPEQREKLQSWFFNELMPAGDVDCRFRVLSNDLHPECLANVLARAQSGWTVKRYPWLKINAASQEESVWPERYPLDHIERVRQRMYALGRGADYEAQYMCRSSSPEGKPFKPEMMRIQPRIRTWEAVYLAFDPARGLLGKNAADCGFAAWSWIGSRLVIWDAWGRKLLPDQVVAAVYEENERYKPVTVGVDQLGLNEFLLQPLRQEGLKRGVTLPLKPVPAAKSKEQRILALQPFFNAREAEFALDLPALSGQLLAFPTGPRDVVDCLAYSLVMRPGSPMYEDWSLANAAEGLEPVGEPTLYLALNATRSLLTGVLLQSFDGCLRIYRDSVREGDPKDLLPDLIAWAQLETGRMPKLVAGPLHFDEWNNVGLVQAANRLQYRAQTGSKPEQGQLNIRELLRRQRKGFPALLVGVEARWTLNAFAGGYARALLKGGLLADFADEGPYRVLMEGLESFAGLIRAGLSPDQQESDRFNAMTSGGKPYMKYQTSRSVGGER